MLLKRREQFNSLISRNLTTSSFQRRLAPSARYAEQKSSDSHITSATAYATQTTESAKDVGSVMIGSRPSGANWNDKLKDLAEQQAKGQRVGIENEQGEVEVLVNIPDDVRTYTWRSSEWTWGVLERLFQDCEQAKITFEMEQYVDDTDGKVKTRVKEDENGMHAGVGTGWWFEGMKLQCPLYDMMTDL